MFSQAIPSISIAIPVYNDPAGVQTTIESLLDQTQHLSKVEIIIIDNNSTDNTYNIAKQYADEHDNITVVRETAIQSSYAARNKGIEHATGDILVFFDADQQVTDGWLEAALTCLEKQDADYLAPNIELDAGDDPTLIGQYNKTTGFPIEDFLTYHRYAPTSCLIVRRELIDDVGAFDERLISGGDLEFGNRVDEAGYTLGFCPDSTVIHPTRNTVRALVKRNIRIGRGHCQLQHYYPARYGRVGIPPQPSDIRSKQYDDSQGRLIFTLLTLIMTATRGLGYYRECLKVWGTRLRDKLGS